VILRGIHIAHWCCIARLDLDDLPLGNVVLYGPNRTGKSSLLKAVRGCLFDLDHDTGRAELKSSLPWNGAGPPQVSVEFETAGQIFRITKIYSKRIDGLATLERKAGDQWQVVEASPREAARRTRELLGTDKSQLGLNQLLWLDQGIVSLPAARDVDPSLEKRLVSVLGVMVTGRDLGFKQALDKRADRWFNVRGGHRPTSPVTLLSREKEERQKRLAEQQARFREVEQAILDLDNCERRLPACERELEEARKELDELFQEKEHSIQRRQEYQQAVKDCRRAEEEMATAEEMAKTYQETKSRWQAAEQESAQGEIAAQTARQEQDRLSAEHANKKQQLHQAREAEDDYQQARGELEDRRELLRLAQQRERMVKDLEAAQALLQEIDAREVEIQKAPAPDKEALESLRGNRREAESLRNQLRTQGLTVTINLHQPASLHLQVDGGSAEKADLPPDRGQTWLVQQRARIDIADLGTLEVTRNQESIDLKRAAERLAQLDREYRDILLAFDELADDETCLNRLTERRVLREKALSELQAARKALDQVAPEGLKALESELTQMDRQREIICQRQPALGDWVPTEGELQQRERQFQAHSNELQKARKSLEEAEQKLAQDLHRASDRFWEWNERAATAKATAQAAREHLQRLGDEDALEVKRKQTQENLVACQARVREAALTEAEQSIEDRCQAAEDAFRCRNERLTELKGELKRHRGRLEGSEGLHTRLADAEAAVLEIDEALAKETRAASAHKRLRDLFQECRDCQIQHVMEPIAGRVLGWARTLGLGDYREVRFGDRFLPEGLVPENGQPEALRGLGEESYGTVEQLGLLIRLALGGVLARDEPVVTILDDPLAHADPIKHRRMLDLLRLAAEGNPAWEPPAGRMQILILTCHPDRFDYFAGAYQIDLASLIVREDR
jgi:DNA repair exonuclease SbcCD ATPase subunit